MSNYWWATCLWLLSWPSPCRCPLPWRNLPLWLPNPTTLVAPHAHLRNQMAMPPIQGGDYWTHYSCQRTYPLEVERREASCRVQRKLLGGLLLGHWSSPGCQADMFWDALLCLLTRRDLRTSPVFFWEMITSANLLTVQNLWSPRGLGQMERPEVCP